MKYSSKTLQNMLFFNRKSTYFFHFSFNTTLAFPLTTTQTREMVREKVNLLEMKNKNLRVFYTWNIAYFEAFHFTGTFCWALAYYFWKVVTCNIHIAVLYSMFIVFLNPIKIDFIFYCLQNLQSLCFIGFTVHLLQNCIYI